MTRTSKSAMREHIQERIRKLPADVDPILAADVALEILVDSGWRFSRDCKSLPTPVIRELLGRQPRDATHVYLTLAVDADGSDAALAKGWARAMQGLADLETINRWASPPKKAKFRALAADPHLLPAIQGAAANGENVSNDMLAVLVVDGSDASIDALIPHLDTTKGNHRLDALRLLRVHARDTPALRALFAELDADADKVSAPAHRIARSIGLPESKVFWFTASIWAQVPSHSVAPVQAHVTIDSRNARWFEVNVTTVVGGTIGGHTVFSPEVDVDELELGRCEAAEIPGWLATVAKKLRVAWGAPHISSNVRGSKREQIAAWLLPVVAAPVKSAKRSKRAPK